MTGMYQVYVLVVHVLVCHIHSAGLFNCTLLGLTVLISAVRRFSLGLSADPFCLGHRKSSKLSLRPAKVPHPGFDLINMAAPVCSLACTFSTTEFEGLLLS
jgi:hypothetical protein